MPKQPRRLAAVKPEEMLFQGAFQRTVQDNLLWLHVVSYKLSTFVGVISTCWAVEANSIARRSSKKYEIALSETYRFFAEDQVGAAVTKVEGRFRVRVRAALRGWSRL
jgi:hypothetical protein